MLTVPWGQAALFLVVAAVVGVLAALWPGGARRPDETAGGHRRNVNRVAPGAVAGGWVG